MFGLDLHLQAFPYVVYASSEGSGEVGGYTGSSELLLFADLICTKLSCAARDTQYVSKIWVDKFK